MSRNLTAWILPVTILLIVCVLPASLFAQTLIRVTPETDYPIIDRSSQMPLAKIRTDCLPASDTDPVARCTVKKFGDLGQVDGVNYFYVLYEWLDQSELEEYKATASVRYPKSNTAVILFYSRKESPNVLHAFYSDRNEFNAGWFEEPKILRQDASVFLQIPHRSASTAESEPDMLLAWKDSTWHLIDTHSWVEDLQTRLPQDCSVIRVPTINFAYWTVSSMVWKSSDDQSAPTCGKVHAKLSLDDNRLVIKSLRYDVKARN